MNETPVGTDITDTVRAQPLEANTVAGHHVAAWHSSLLGELVDPAKAASVLERDKTVQMAPAEFAALHVLPKKIGPYRVLGELGRGSMGAVYLGEHELSERRAAIKIMLQTVDADMRERFLREGRALCSITHHPNVVGAYDVGEDGRTIYLAMELIEGVILVKWRKG